MGLTAFLAKLSVLVLLISDRLRLPNGLPHGCHLLPDQSCLQLPGDMPNFRHCRVIHVASKSLPVFCLSAAPIRQPLKLPGGQFQNRAHPLPQNSILPQKKFPGADPRAYRICHTVRENRGACVGEGLAGGGHRGPDLPEKVCRAGRGQLRGGCKCPKEFSRRPAMDSRPSAYLKNTSALKEIPRRGPPGRLHLQYSTRKSGACAGEVWAGEAPEGPASP